MIEMIKERRVRYSYHLVFQINKTVKRGFFDFNKEICNKNDILAVEKIINDTHGTGCVCGNGTKYLSTVELLDWHLLETYRDDEPRYDLATIVDEM